MNDLRSGIEKTRAGTAVHPNRYVARRTRKYKKNVRNISTHTRKETTTTTLYIIDSESSVAVQLQGGSGNAHVAVIAIHHCALATVSLRLRAMSCHGALATCTLATVPLPLPIRNCALAHPLATAAAMCHCKKLSRPGFHTTGVPDASFLLSI